MASGLKYAGEMSGLTFLDETSLRQYGPEQLLNCMLSTRTYISTSSSLAVRNQEASECPDLKAFTQVGKGQCGTVWALTGTTKVLKIMNQGKLAQLGNDYRKHAHVEMAFMNTSTQFRRNINLPELGDFIGPHNERFWTQHSDLFPENIQSTNGFLSTRIFPLPLPVRSAIVGAFGPKIVRDNKESFLSHPENKDCLVRIYLGRRQQRLATNTFKLRNFDMTVNEMEYLRLDTESYAETMAQTLAIIHWKAKIDANDVEFVFGCAPTSRMRPSLDELEATPVDALETLGNEVDFKHRAIGIWILDFDQCSTFPEDANGVKQLERGFYFNDPYYPRPSSNNPKDAKLWSIFRERYLATSAAFTPSNMPKLFIAAVEAEGKKRSGGGSLFG